ncbi:MULTISPECIES: peptidase [unclassified Microcoleus]|uniref:peptidase n=1 Tax=unclassified Microcoleus TaxID=2642155 RepID=UPI002FCEE19D
MTAIQEPTIKTTPFDDLIADFNKIRSLYTVEDPLEAFKLIIDQEVMVSLILEAHSKIRELFPTERLGLEVKTDPEIANWRSLWITIYTKLDVEEAFAKLNILDDSWWLEAKIAAPKNDLHISLEWESNEI